MYLSLSRGVRTWRLQSHADHAGNPQAEPTAATMVAPACYEIRVQGYLPRALCAYWFEGLSLREEADGETILAGTVDQSALHSALTRIRDLNIPLISVIRSLPSARGEIARRNPPYGRDRG